jgi:hypothetical protein
MDFQVGQTVIFVGAHRHNAGAKEMKITKIGRKWLSLENGYRVDRETLAADGAGYVSPGRAYVTREEYEAKLALENEWEGLCKVIRSSYSPTTSNIQAVREAKRLLNIE